MDLSKNVVLKENYSFFVGDEAGQISGGEHGLYNRDTRFLNRYCWDFGEHFQTLLAYSPRPDKFHAHYALIEGPSQALGIQRHLEISALGLVDKLELDNSSEETRKLTLRLSVAADFVDMFEARGWTNFERSGIERRPTEKGVVFHYHSEDRLDFSVQLDCSPFPDSHEHGGLGFNIRLAAGEKATLDVHTKLQNPLEVAGQRIGYDDWRKSADLSTRHPRHQEVLAQAIDDLRALLLFTEHGPLPAAGIPWFVAAFGRDALLSTMMMLPWRIDVAEGILRYLAAYQGEVYDTFRAEAPGKIMHELRYGELTRTGKTPHSPYYGTIDATALFVMLLRETWQHTGKLTLVKELRPNWEAALAWMQQDGDLDGDGFLEFAPAEVGRGLTVQSWKDSDDSMSHADGSLAEGALAVSEVQGYTYAAYQAAADFYEALGEGELAKQWHDKATALKERFHEAFWLEDMQTYAMALDGAKKPLKVHNSDAGQLLWTGIVPEDIAPKLVATLMSAVMWTGWGIRTLGKHEVRYNPVSYHNGSVWPHDTALIAGGMARYGFKAEAAKIREATFDLAASQPDKRPPELVAGYERNDAPPVPYPAACRPQAWDAAALLYLLRL